MTKTSMYSNSQTFWLVILRVFIGWHFLYEGIVKALNSSWSALPYLKDSDGIFSNLFNYIADTPALLSSVNVINTWGLTLIGLCLILGLFSKYATLGGIAFLAMFFLSHPPFIGAEYMMPTEGSYLWIDKNLIEIAAMFVLLVFPTSQRIGLDRLLKCK